jgi:hypothetical protein
MVQQKAFKGEAQHGEACLQCGGTCNSAHSSVVGVEVIGPFCSWRCLDDWEMAQEEEADDDER